jgi:hypothetical protein
MAQPTGADCTLTGLQNDDGIAASYSVVANFGQLLLQHRSRLNDPNSKSPITGTSITDTHCYGCSAHGYSE